MLNYTLSVACEMRADLQLPRSDRHGDVATG